MKIFCFLIIPLFVGLLKAAGQAVTPKPIDLAITAEIVHAVKPTERLVNATQYVPYLRLSIRNQTKHPRSVTFMSCSWGDSWVQKGAYSLCGGWLCEKNNPITIAIPAGKALAFCGLMCGRHGEESKTGVFSIGFTDYAQSHFWHWPTKAGEQKTQKAPTVYWSNQLDGRINIADTPEITAPYSEQSYSLSDAGK